MAAVGLSSLRRRGRGVLVVMEKRVREPFEDDDDDDEVGGGGERERLLAELRLSDLEDLRPRSELSR